MADVNREDATNALLTLLKAAIDLLKPAAGVEVVVPSNAADLVSPSRALYVGVGGDVNVNMFDGSSATFVNVPSGTRLDIRATRVFATGTTATNMISYL